MLGLGLSAPYSVMAEEDDVTIRMMDMNETAYENVMKEIELPEAASDTGRERSAKGLANANAHRALNREREHNDDMDPETDMDTETDIDADEAREMAKENHATGLERADEVRANNQRPDHPERPEHPARPELPELPEAAETHRSEHSNR